MDLNSKSYNCSIFNLVAQYFVLLERMFGAHMVHDTSVHQIFQAMNSQYIFGPYFMHPEIERQHI